MSDSRATSCHVAHGADNSCRGAIETACPSHAPKILNYFSTLKAFLVVIEGLIRLTEV